MYAIRPATVADQPAVVALLVRLQADPEHHIGYHGVTAEEVAEEFGRFAPDWVSGAVLGTDDSGAVRAVLSVDADAETGRAWLHGPFVDVPAAHPAGRQVWHNTADDLFDAALALPRLKGIDDLELYGHRRNRRLGDFAARQGFSAGAASRVFTLTGSALRSVLVSAVDAGEGPRVLGAEPAIRAQVVELHERCFPQRTVSGRQLVDGERGHTVVVLTGVDGLIGYAAGFVAEDELYLDYVAVDPNMRDAGAGRALVRSLLRALAARHGARQRAAAVIALGNDASERMFTALGFDLHLELVGYRRK
ncbi:GNAT family N-acetyltransferase [Actinokineospora iranica]|uniref:Ribosomal protein S18 acetylase RimI n=1 Tax=Actinokineospora iranica TaxID=1271860 RepID=A0A1G6NAS8_9PSEU|nr:GNAT family N-acetyltransferase [Actinokineospora iranica]SDC64791.1 Ribosomal protein S18 acetylase RimI [Actinokineospora iranica]